MASLKRLRRGDRAGECRLHVVDLDVSHQPVAVRHETACGFGGDWPVRSSCLAESGSTTEPRSGSGAEGGHVSGCWVFHATGSTLTAAEIDQQDNDS
ncbi:hypothetical protein FR762_24475 (plasmid) [Enterobacter sp. E76]|nr:hypothetical protein FR762_24475 [Enterobacter sp. E76]